MDPNKWFSFSRRISRKTYILRCFSLYLVSFIIGMITGEVILPAIQADPRAHTPLLVALILML
ncbi:MAG: hypothetical protein LUD41_05930 [Phascolarctobacterium sp.]|nr:hypothetical protein [Phascolarctobacterium sp.]